ncbi:universal stress protein [Halorussus amylolyticus]|uniref:universal stress protein n=1 Tax=Halorussus amylolyticus TaxID=1126242 RepID=UPI0010443527|nr:universal stress protein [Halorussus amylolyticus]
MYERILVPTDGSDAVGPAVAHAIDLAKTYDAELHVLNAVNLEPAAFENGSTVVDRLEKAGRDATDAVTERAESEGLDRVTADVTNGEPHTAILDYTADNDIDLVVMGTHGRTGLDRHLLGSVTEKAVRTADAPVLTVRKPDSDDAES